MHRQGVQFSSEQVEIVRPNLVFGRRSIKRYIGGAAIASVVQQYTKSGSIDCFREASKLGVGATTSRRKSDPGTAVADNLVIERDPADEGFRHFHFHKLRRTVVQ